MHVPSRLVRERSAVRQYKLPLPVCGCDLVWQRAQTLSDERRWFACFDNVLSERPEVRIELPIIAPWNQRLTPGERLQLSLQRVAAQARFQDSRVAWLKNALFGATAHMNAVRRADVVQRSHRH